VAQLLEVRSNVRKAKPETLDQQFGAGLVGHQHGIRVMLACEPYGQAPREQMVQWL